MNLKIWKICDYIAVKTLRNKGVTYSIREKREIKNDPYFVVGVFPELTQTIPIEEFKTETIYNFVLNHPQIVTQCGIAVGTWVSGDNVIIDIVALITDKNAAICLGKVFNQVSIWDIAKGEEIKTGGKGEPLQELLGIGFGARINLINRINEA